MERRCSATFTSFKKIVNPAICAVDGGNDKRCSSGLMTLEESKVGVGMDWGRQRLAKIRLRMTGIVPQRHEYFAMPQTTRQHVVLNDGDPARVAVLVASRSKIRFEVCRCFRGRLSSATRISSMIPVNRSSFGRAGGRLRRYPGGTENASILATVRGAIP